MKSHQQEQDQREALYNDRATGPATAIQLCRESVTRLDGLVIDFDANVLKDNPHFPPAATAEEFHAAIRPVLDRHAILRHAEVRDTGRWLHGIVRFASPVELRTAAEQRRWNGLHQLLKASVPSDPAAHSLIALTRPIGSINSKTGRTVRTLKEGTPIDPDALVAWAEAVRKSPFAGIGRVLFGEQRISPCPYCLSPGSRLDLGDQAGICYGPCRRIPLARIHEPFMAVPEGEAKVSRKG